MEYKYFLFFDDVKCILPSHKLKVLRQNKDRTFSLGDLPIVMSCNLSEFECKVGPLVYVLSEEKDEKIIKENISKIMYLEKIDESKYHIVAAYDKNNVFVKQTNIAEVTDDDRRKFICINNLDSYSKCDILYVLKQNDDGTVSITSAPIVIKNSILQYQTDNDCFLVTTVNGDEEKYNKEDLMELEPTGEENKYNFIRVYGRDKVAVKKLSDISKKD